MSELLLDEVASRFPDSSPSPSQLPVDAVYYAFAEPSDVGDASALTPESEVYPGEAPGQAGERQLLGRIAFGPPAEQELPQHAFGCRSRWDRLSLGPNVELRVRRPLSRAENRAVERLLQAARELFQNDEEEES